MITENDVKEMYKDFLDEEADEVVIGNLRYNPSLVLELVDPIAFNEGLSDYIDSLIEDGEIVEGYNDDNEQSCILCMDTEECVCDD